jgi:hypothetical protein
MAKAISNLSATWANSSNIYTGIGMNINASAYDANSAIIDLKLNSNSIIRLTSNGVLYINGAPIGVSVGNAGPAFDKANSANIIAVAAFDAANAAGGGASAAAFDKANSANIVASSAFDKANAANSLAYNTGIGANAFSSATIAGANTAVGTGANSYAATVGTSANTFLLATITGANTAVGTGANSYAATVGTSANAFASATIAGANTISIAAFGRANVINVVANLAFDKANSALANTSGISFNGSLTFPAGTVQANGTSGQASILGYSTSAHSVRGQPITSNYGGVIGLSQNGLKYGVLGYNNADALNGNGNIRIVHGDMGLYDSGKILRVHSSGQYVAYANGTSVNLGSTYTTASYVLIYEANSGSSAGFFVGYNYSIKLANSPPGYTFANTDTGSAICLFCSGHTLTLKNATGAALNMSVAIYSAYGVA